ncbi:MAG: hemerythrin domain-containing protein [Fibrobacteria bacterium]|nr:hemerythrin domain-containing protein [Fibrobacteria bacterium]
MHTGMLRQQHHEILAIVNEMRRHLLAPQRMTAAVADGLRANLVALSGKVTVHLSVEDKGLYPRLLASQGTSAAETAQRFSEEMGHIGSSFKEFLGHWPSGEHILREPVKFVDECATIFQVLSHRIEREEKELYALADSLH